MNVNQYNFGPASSLESIVYGAKKPGNNPESIDDWIEYMRKNSIQRVCCLLSNGELEHGLEKLTSIYQTTFGVDNVCHAPIRDGYLASDSLLIEIILPFLKKSDQSQQKVVVHCHGGSGRTGHVLAAWLVYFRGLDVKSALTAIKNVERTFRNPLEAVQWGNATEKEFDRLYQIIATFGDHDH